MLPNIELTRIEYESFLQVYYRDGSEGKIIRDGRKAIKIFHKNFGHYDISLDEIEEIRENKFSKIVSLFSMKEKFLNEFQPLTTYSYMGKFVGFDGFWMPYDTMQFACLLREEQIFYLKKTREKLEKFHELGIVYGDVKDHNILIDTLHQDVIFIDIDNMQVGDYPIDLMGYSAREFISRYGRVDWKLDSYMMNLMVIDQLNHCNIGDDRQIYDCLEYGFLPVELLQENRYQSKKLARQMRYVDQKYSGKYFIDMI